MMTEPQRPASDHPLLFFPYGRPWARTLGVISSGHLARIIQPMATSRAGSIEVNIKTNIADYSARAGLKTSRANLDSSQNVSTEQPNIESPTTRWIAKWLERIERHIVVDRREARGGNLETSAAANNAAARPRHAPSYVWLWLLLMLLVTHVALLAYGAAVHSPTVDEVAHLPAGISHWHGKGFALFRVNPHLVRSVAALPVLAMRPKTDWRQLNDEPGERVFLRVGDDFVSGNGEQTFRFLTAARWACIPFSLLGSIICFAWARDLYGQSSGVLAACLWCLSPNILAQGQLITPDVGAAALGAFATYLFYLWLSRPIWWRATICSIALGLAELTKTTWVILFVLWPLLWTLWRYGVSAQGLLRRANAAPETNTHSNEATCVDARNHVRPDHHPEAGTYCAKLGVTSPRPDTYRRSNPSFVQLVAMLLGALIVLNIGYLFEGSGTRLGDYSFVCRSFSGLDKEFRDGVEQGNRFADTWLAALPIPLPKPYVMGIDITKREFEIRLQSYLNGEWRNGGWWYYYLYAAAIKVPLGTWLLFGAALVLTYFEWRRFGFQSAELVLLLPAISVFSLVSSQTGFNHHFRYVLPALPFVFIWISKVANVAIQRRGLWRFFVATALLWMTVASLRVYPHSLSYFNELVGGPIGGHAHLINSNIDWGQDVFFLKRWLDRHPEAKPLGFAFSGRFDPAFAGIEYRLPPAGPDGSVFDVSRPPSVDMGPKPGWYAVSVNALRGQRFPAWTGQSGDGKQNRVNIDGAYFAYFLEFEPVAMAGYSIYIYHLEPQEVNRVRRKLRLPEMSHES